MWLALWKLGLFLMTRMLDFCHKHWRNINYHWNNQTELNDPCCLSMACDSSLYKCSRSLMELWPVSIWLYVAVLFCDVGNDLPFLLSLFMAHNSMYFITLLSSDINPSALPIFYYCQLINLKCQVNQFFSASLYNR